MIERDQGTIRGIKVYWWDDSAHLHSGDATYVGTLNSCLQTAKTGNLLVWDKGLNGGEWLPVQEIELDRRISWESGGRLVWFVWLLTDNMLGGGYTDEAKS